MKITNRACLDSGAETHGFRAFKDGLTWRDAEARWTAYKSRSGQRRNSLWIKAALKGYRQAGGYVCPKRLPTICIPNAKLIHGDPNGSNKPAASSPLGGAPRSTSSVAEMEALEKAIFEGDAAIWHAQKALDNIHR